MMNSYSSLNAAIILMIGLSPLSLGCNRSSDSLPADLDLNALAKTISGHWVTDEEPKTLPNGEKEDVNYGIQYQFNPTRTTHGTWKYDHSPVGGDWRLTDIYKNGNGTYSVIIKRFATNGGELANIMNTHRLDQITKNTYQSYPLDLPHLVDNWVRK
jgi:hypothetical protein